MTGALILIKTLASGLFRRLRAGLIAILRWAFRHPWQAATLALGAWLALLLLSTLPARDAALADAIAQAHAEAAAHDQTKIAYAAAQITATKMALTQKAAFETRYTELADHADAQFTAGRAQALAAATRHIAANRITGCVPDPGGNAAAAAGSAPGSAPAPASDHPAGSSDTASGGAELVAVTADDVQICTINTSRMIEARQWALSLAAASQPPPE